MFNAYREVFLLPRPVWMLFWAGVINRVGQMVLPPFLGTAAWQAFGLPGYAWFCLVSGGITAALLWRMR